MRKSALQFWYAGSFAIVLLNTSPTQAQIVPDNTLPVNSQVGNCGAACMVINGGTVREANLFHSFRQFSIPTGGEAHFNNTAQIQNILTRVTGTSLSNIDGLIRANGIANLYLVNPNGIVFGPNASLNIGGSFVATTAGSLKFANGSEFSAIDPQAPPILAVNLTPGVQFGTRAPESRVSNAGNLTVPAGQSITLLGETTTSTGTLTAPGGMVQVLGDRVALQENARVDVSSATAGGTVLIGGDYKGQGTVPNATQTYVGLNTTINADAKVQGNGGRVIVWSDGNTSFDGTITAQGGVRGGNGGFVETSGKNTLTIGDMAKVNTLAYQGQTGTWLLDPTSITIIASDDTSSTDRTIEGINARSGASRINNFRVQETLKDSNVTLNATDQINVNTTVSADSRNNLTLQARSINLNGGTLILRGGGNIILDTTQNRGTPSQTTQGTSVFITGSELRDFTGVIDTGVSKEQVRKGGDIQIITGSLALTNGASLTTSTLGVGSSGDIKITANSLSMSNGAALSASTLGDGNSGNVYLNITRSTNLEGTGINQLENVERATGIYSQVNGNGGGGGNIEIKSDSLSLTKGAAISASTNGKGDAGDIKLEIRGLLLLDGVGQLKQMTDQYIVEPGDSLFKITQKFYGDLPSGNQQLLQPLYIENRSVITPGPDFRVDAGIALTIPSKLLTYPRLSSADVLLVSKKTTAPSAITSQVNAADSGNGGKVDIMASSLNMTNASILSTSTFATAPGKGNAGDIILHINTFDAASNSQITSQTIGSGNAGNISIYVRNRLTLTNTNSRANDPSQATGIYANTGSKSSGIGGSIIIAAQPGTRPAFLIQDGAKISVSSQGSGNGGNIEIMTPERITLDKGTLTATTTSTANGGNITIDPDILLLRRGSQITTSAGNGAPGNGGNISITAGFVVGLLSENSDIVANAFTGSGGRITINANSIFGFLPAPQGILDTRFSDIAASSRFGISGFVILNTLNVDPSQGLGELNLVPADSSNLVAKSCATGKREALNENRFAATGRSGLPASPDDVFRNSNVLTELGTPTTTEAPANAPSSSTPASSTSPRIVEAQGWTIAPNGNVRLVAQAPSVSPTAFQQPGLTCPDDSSPLRP